MTDKPVVLTAGMAEVLLHDARSRTLVEACHAIATGLTVVIPVWTEAQAREAFAKHVTERQMEYAEPVDVWLACARSLGAVAPEQEGRS